MYNYIYIYSIKSQGEISWAPHCREVKRAGCSHAGKSSLTISVKDHSIWSGREKRENNPQLVGFISKRMKRLALGCHEETGRENSVTRL